MGLIARLISETSPDAADKIPVHTWPKLFDAWKRGRVTLTTMIDAYSLSDKSETIAQVVTGTDKLGLSVDHTWADNDGVYITTTGTVPGGLSLDTLYYVINSAPLVGTIKVATSKGGAAIDITSEGTGTHTLNRVEVDVIFWEETRLDITSTISTADQKLRRRMWDEIAEGVGEIAEEGIAFTSETDFKTELTNAATWLTVS